MSRPRESRDRMSMDLIISAKRFCYDNLTVLYDDLKVYEIMDRRRFYHLMAGEQDIQHWIKDLEERLLRHGIIPGVMKTAGKYYEEALRQHPDISISW